MQSNSPGRRLTRLAVATLGFVLVFAVLANSAMAASTYSEKSPAEGSVSAAALPLISVKVSDPAGISTGFQLKIDGVSRTPKVKWIDSKTVVLSYQQTAPLKNGSHSVYASVYTYAGRTSNTWSFTTKVPPTIGPLSPADGSTTNLQRPTISAGVSANGVAVSSYTLSVDGVAVTPGYNATTKQIIYTPAADLANDSQHTASLTVTDASGMSTTVIWNFNVQVYADMNDTVGCSECHIAYPVAHPMGNCAGCHDGFAPFPAYWNMEDLTPVHGADYIVDIDCAYCHSSVFPAVPRHVEDVRAAHVTSDDMSGCACHVRSLTIEHNRYLTDAGDPIACTGCHGPNVEQRVLDALASGNTSCLGCHDSAEHEELHFVTLEESCVGCHKGGSLTSIHLVENHLACATCHKSTDQRVIDALANNDKACSACHGAQHALDKSFCYGCHQSTLLTYNGQSVADQSKHMAATSSARALTQYPDASQPATACGNCHDDHDGGTRADGNELCYTCHDGAGTTKPVTASYQGKATFASAGHATAQADSGRTVVLTTGSSGFAAWESSSQPSPTSPGTALSQEKLAGLKADDGNRAITSAANSNGGYDYQMYRFKLPVDAASVGSASLRWVGFGEETPNYPVDLCIWNRTLNDNAGGWQTLRSSQMVNEAALQFAVTPAQHADGDRNIYVMAKAKNVIDSTLVSGPTLSPVYNGFRVDWSTLGVTSGHVDFGATSAYGATYGSSTRTTAHSVQVPLTSGATYHYRVRSTGRDGDTWSTPDTVVTAAYATPIAVGSYSSYGPVTVNFRWNPPASGGTNLLYRLRMKSVYGSFVYVSDWTALTNVVVPNIGLDYYTWQVETKNILTGNDYLPSTPSYFSIYEPGGSCPFLYTWDGGEYAFEADLNTTGMLGSKNATAYWKPDPRDRYILNEEPVLKDGKLELRLVEERHEIDYTDEFKLYAVDVPVGVDVYAEKGERGKLTPLLPGGLHTVADLRAPLSAVRTDTGADVKAGVVAVDGNYLQLNEDANVGFDYKTVELDLGDVSSAPQVKIVMNAESQRPSTPEGLARQRTFGATTKLEVQNLDGTWREAAADEATLPNAMEFARSYVFDITGAMHDTTGRVRFTFLFKTYIDMIGFDTSADQTLEVTEVPMESATLGWHGIDAKTATGDIYDYAYGQTGSPIPTIPGTYTKFGNVTSLLHGTDDKFVIYGTCDELQMRFEPVAAPAQGLTRRYVAFIDGYYKSDKSLVPLEVSPLPFSAMSNYPYPETESYPADSDHATYLSQWNTRVETGEPRVPVGEAGLTDDGTHRSLNVDYVSLEVGYQDATASTAGGCSMCHNVHGQPDAETGAMTVGSVWKSEDRLCTGDGASGCHASTTASSAGVNIAAAFSGTDPRMHHDVAPKDQRATGSKIACSSCHNPHRDSGGSKISNPDAKGSAATGTSRYLNADGKMYVLVGALHDGAKPVISAVSLDASALFTAPRVSWTTNEVASTWIDWGTTTSYGETAGGNTPVTSHSVVMSGLTANVTYHYRLRSADQLGNEQVSADYTYTPLAPPALPVPTPAPDTAFDNGAGVPYTLSWSAVTSPDGDPVQYQLVVDATAYPWQSANSKTLTMWGGQHSWKVRVRDAVHIDAATPYTEADVFYVTDNTIYSGSCPFLFTWDGDSYEFEADTFVGGRIGTKRGASYLLPTPSDSYVVRTPVAEKDGSLEFRLVEERYETDYLDKISLKAVDAPAGARVFAEKPVSGAPYPTFPGSLHTVRDLRAPLSARHLNSDTDVLGKISADDGEQLVLNEQREADFTYQTIEMDLGDVADAPKVKIVMDAVSCFPVTTEGLAHSATFNSRTKLEVQDNAGVWQTVPTSVASLTLPPEFSRPFIFDITNAARSSSGKVRFTYLYKTYIDSIQVDTSADEPITVTDVPLDSATLASHGVDEQTGNGDISEFNYGEAVSQGELFPGAYTKYGDVSPLLSGSDDKFVIAGQGDELTLRFTPPAEPAQGLARQFVFDVDGYYKDAKTDLARTVEPLPFHAMSNYPYPSTESYPSDAEHDAYRVEWNTRIVEAESNQAAASTGSLLARLVEAVESAFDSVRDAAVALLDGGTNRIVVAKADETQRIHYSVNTDRLGVRLTLQDGSLATAAVANAWQSTGSAPTPAGPGSVVVAASTQIAAKDGDYWITDLATTDRNTNWQLAEVQLTESARKSVHNVFVEWVGHGEPTATYPTSLYLWNFETNAWDVKASGQAATDLAFNAEEEQTDNSFCLKCHDGTAPSGVTLPAGSRDIATAWTATTGDVHGAAVGSGNYQSGLSPEYKAGQPAIPCGTCHDSHGTGNLYHLRSTINGKSGISAATGSTVESACRACHTGDAGVWHQSCNDCHFDPESHVSAPYVGAGQDCASCHSHAKTWSHPASCHCGPWPSTFKTF